MQLDHERLDVYELALDFLVLANGIIEGLPRGRSHLADQFTRATLSIVLNLAEGAGKHSKLDKRRYYLTARGSATESAALLDVCVRLKLLDDAGHRAAKGMLVRVVSMLIKPPRSCGHFVRVFRAASLPKARPSLSATAAHPAGNEPSWMPHGAHPKTHGKPNLSAPSGTGTGTFTVRIQGRALVLGATSGGFALPWLGGSG